MAKLVFSYEPELRAFGSSIFPGPCNIQVAFKDDRFHNVTIETRLDETLSWVALKSFSGEKALKGIIKHAAEGQQFRLVVVNDEEPESAHFLPLSVAQSSGSGSASEDENVINPEDIQTIGTDAAQDIVADAINDIEGQDNPQTEGPQTDEPQTEEPQTESPQTEGPQTEGPQEETPTETQTGGGTDDSGD